MGRLALVMLLTVAAGWPGGAAADQTDHRLPALFDQLKSTTSDTDAQAVEAQIWQIWTEPADGETALLMVRGLKAMAAEEEREALAAFDAVVKRKPDFAEGWNKRATVYFLLGQFDASVADIEQTLRLEPRHFGALSGLGQIYLALDNKKAALKAFEAALAIDPHLTGVRAAVEGLKRDLDGDPT